MPAFASGRNVAEIAIFCKATQRIPLPLLRYANGRSLRSNNNKKTQEHEQKKQERQQVSETHLIVHISRENPPLTMSAK